MIRVGQPDGWTLANRYQPVMGTHLELQITAPTEAEAKAAEASALAEAARLEARFTVFDPASELSAWRRGDLVDPSPDLTDLLDLAARWHAASDGTFNPLTGVVTDRWQRAAREGTEPSSAELDQLAASIREPRFAVRDGRVHRLGPCDDVDLNALAKGHVVDRVAAHVLAHHDVSRLVVNAGGDLVHRGTGAVRIAVEDPQRPYDNLHPLLRITITDAAVATSGRSRRWFDVGGVRHSRVLDPRTGSPVAHTAAATVIAPDATTADVVATAASVLAPADTMELLVRLRCEGMEVAALVIDRDGAEHRSDGWTPAELPTRPPAPC